MGTVAMVKIDISIFSIFALSFIAFGCSGSKFTFPEPAIPAAENSFVSQAGKFKTGSHEYAADFGTITVPENRNKVGSRLIHLPVIRIHARSSIPDEPIFYLAGGPGQSNIECIPLDTLLVNHDFIMVGYRGVDGSVKLDCPEVVDALKENDDPLTEESLMRLAKAWEASARRFAREGIDWNGYTIPQTVEDMETVRRVLKYQRINLQSESYGTRLAYLYGLTYPEHVHRSIMIGAGSPGNFMWDPQTVDEQLNAYAKLWSRDSIISARCPDLIVAMRRALQTMPKKWLFFFLNPGKIKITAFCMLFQRNSAALVFDAFVKADEGDYSGLALLSIAYDYIIPSIFTWGDLTKAVSGTNIDSARIKSFTAESPDAILGSPLNTLLWKPLLYGHIPIQPIPQELRTLKPSNVETLILSGSLDFSCPPKYATQELLPYLRNGKQIILSECGHVGDLIYLRKQSTKRIMASYYNTGIPDTSGVEYVPMNFEVSWGLPSIAKTVLVVGTVVVLSAAAGLIWVATRFW
jgi:pimeloyl-ACP methyl ester carboxylesterase